MIFARYGPSWWFKMVGAVQEGKLLVDVGFNIGGVSIVAGAQVANLFIGMP